MGNYQSGDNADYDDNSQDDNNDNNDNNVKHDDTDDAPRYRKNGKRAKRDKHDKHDKHDKDADNVSNGDENNDADGESENNDADGEEEHDNDEEYDVKRRYGWKRDIPDHRDKYFTLSSRLTEVPLPDKIDLRDKCPLVYDQGKIGSCTANGLAGAYHFDEMKQKNSNVFMPSRLFIYYNERAREGTTDSDSGASIRDGLKTMVKIGVCSEDSWEYESDELTTKPHRDCYKEAKKHRAIKYKRVAQREPDLKQCLASGVPIVFGFTVYDSFEEDDITKTGLVKMPEKNEKILGGHCVMLVGYYSNANDEANPMKAPCWIVRNSWSDKWGDKGYAYFPMEYLLNTDLAADFWAIKKVSR